MNVDKIPDFLYQMGELLRTQDNRYTDQPMFIVQQKRPMIVDGEFNEVRIEWCETEGGGYANASGLRTTRLETLYCHGREVKGWHRYEIADVWEFVTACFTEQGCKDYLRLNGHNLKEPRIYADGSYLNEEFRAVRNWLMSLPTIEKKDGAS